MVRAKQIRPAAVSGMFYPADPTLLSLNVDSLLEKHAPSVQGTLIGLISPHAGYMYSGYTAAAGYAELRGRGIKTAVIVSPSHREYFNGLSIYDGDAYRTPLGIVEIDAELRERLLQHKGAFMLSKFGHRDEHAIEVQLPFLQRIDDDIRIVPIVMGDQRHDLCMLLGEILGKEIHDDRTIVIASSDLSHMHRHIDARTLDDVAAEDIRDFSPAKLMNDIASHRTEACGAGPIAAVLHASFQRGATHTHILHQCTSGDVTGERERVVGYLSAAIMKSPGITSPVVK
jgi:MEMO1 family protein